jgi:hypothetical protein
MSDEGQHLLWWVIPGVLAGMPMPFIHWERRMKHGAPLPAYDDDLPVLLRQASARLSVCRIFRPTRPYIERQDLIFCVCRCKMVLRRRLTR